MKPACFVQQQVPNCEYYLNYKINYNINVYFSEEKQEEKTLAVPSDTAVAVAATSHKRKKRLRKADTNVLSVKFNRLLQPGN